jgi:hypothetical protein
MGVRAGTETAGGSESPQILLNEPADDPRVAAMLINETTPDSPYRLKLELIELGISPMEKAAAVVDRFGQRYPRISGNSFRAFCAIVLNCVKANPSAYGAAA